jgi:hypothetical protein
MTAKPAFATNEMEEREAIMRKANEAFKNERFAELDAMARRYREKKTRTPSGIWHLTCFYVGIQRAIDSGPDSGERKKWWKVEDTVLHWQQKYPKSPTARIVHSMIMISKGWTWRGSGPSRTVTGENLKEYGNFINYANSDLVLWKKELSDDPQWYRNMLLLSRAFVWSRSEFDGILAEGVKKEPLFYEMYFEALEYLLPKWLGSADHIEEFARKSADATSTLEGQSLYARIYWYAADAQFHDRLFTDTMADWPHMKAGFDDMVARYPDKWNLSAYARFACMAGDRATTRELLDRIGADAMSSYLRPGRTRERCIDWARSETGDEAGAP